MDQPVEVVAPEAEQVVDADTEQRLAPGVAGDVGKLRRPIQAAAAAGHGVNRTVAKRSRQPRGLGLTHCLQCEGWRPDTILGRLVPGVLSNGLDHVDSCVEFMVRCLILLLAVYAQKPRQRA